jgi:hypothetical protein
MTITYMEFQAFGISNSMLLWDRLSSILTTSGTRVRSRVQPLEKDSVSSR